MISELKEKNNPLCVALMQYVTESRPGIIHQYCLTKKDFEHVSSEVKMTTIHKWVICFFKMVGNPDV